MNNTYYNYNCDYQSDGWHPGGILSINGITVGGKPQSLPGYSDPGTPVRLGLCFNNRNFIIYYIVSSTNYNYKIQWTHSDSVPKDALFKISYVRFSPTSSNPGNVTMYIDPSTWIAHTEFLPLFEPLNSKIKIY